jgi:hypothetical protein
MIFQLSHKYARECAWLYFDTTLEILENHFEGVNAIRLKYPFHQPPAPFTYEELNRDFYETVDAFLQRET